MMYQLHHQNKADRTKTEFLSQFGSLDTYKEELQSALDKFPPPEGWEFLACTEESDFFIMTNGKAERKKGVDTEESGN